MRNFLSAYLYYSRRERNGVVLLSALSIVALCIPQLYPFVFKSSLPDMDVKMLRDFAMDSATIAPITSLQPDNKAPFDFDPNTADKATLTALGISDKVATTLVHFREKGAHFYKKEDLRKVYGFKAEDYQRLESYIHIEGSAPSDSYKNAYKEHPPYHAKERLEEVRETHMAVFDPNSASEAALLGLGLSLKSVKVLQNYRQKGGHFYKNEDLKKVYGLTEAEYSRVEPYMQIGEIKQVKQLINSVPIGKPIFVAKDTEQSFVLDANTATEEQWLRLKGIGRIFAAAILNEREKLGGFATKDQIKNIYGLPDSTYQRIKAHLVLNTSIFRRIPINSVGFSKTTHPYLTRRQVEAITRYRMNHGIFKNWEELKQTGVLSDENIILLKPYITFDINQ